MKRNISTTILDFLNENEKIYSGDEIWKYFSNMTSFHHSKYDDPIYNKYKKQILKNNYVLRNISIENLIKNDIELKKYVETQLDFYKRKWTKNNVDTYGLIGKNGFDNDVLIDGYHRLIQKMINGDEVFTVFVPINSKYY